MLKNRLYLTTKLILSLFVIFLFAFFIGIVSSSPAKAQLINGNTFSFWNVNGILTTEQLVVSTSASPVAAAACTAGKIVWDASYIYVCTATGVWKRSALTGGY